MSDVATPMTGVPAEPPARRRRGGLVAVVASVVAVALIAGGGFAAWRFFAGGGPRPVDVLPASTFAVVSLDLDPAGGQKLAAIETLRKLPSFREHTGITSSTDLVKAFYDKTLGPQCPTIDYGRDIKPWIGLRAAFAGVTLDTKPVPAFVVQVTDAHAATAGLTKLRACDQKTKSDFGFTVTSGYAVASDTVDHARAIATAGTTTPLSQSPDYRKWTTEAGGAGIVNAYLAPSSVTVLDQLIGRELAGSGRAGAKNPTAGLARALQGFRGSAAVLRFHDSGLELSFAGGDATPPGKQTSVAAHVQALPADTAAVLAGALDTSTLTRLSNTGATTQGLDFSRGLRQATGLSFPGDLATLLGQSFSISLGGQAPARLAAVKGPADLPVGVLVHGDAAKITSLVRRVQVRTGTRLSDLPATMSTKPGEVSVASTPRYAAQLLTKGTLGSSSAFTDVVPHPEAPFVLYLSLSGNSWGTTLADEARRHGGQHGAEIADDVGAFKALGLSTWTQDGDTHGLLRIALK